MNKIWSASEKQFIKENAGILSDELGAAKLSQIVGRDITVHSYRKQRQVMGIRKKPGRGICAVLEIGETYEKKKAEAKNE